MRDLTQCRADIDKVDAAIIRLLKERLDIAADIAVNKLQAGKPITDLQRERSKLNALCELAEKTGLPPSMASKVFRKIMDDTVSFEQSYLNATHNDQSLGRKVSIAYLGKTAGTYSHLAAMRFLQNYCGEKIFTGCSSFEEVIAAVENGSCEYGALPIENSSSGSINEVLDLLQLTKAHLVGEVFYQIKHSVLGLPGCNPAQLKRIYSHPQPITQCSHWLKENLRDCEIIYTKSTSEAMDLVRQNQDPHAAAIACADSATLYDLQPLFTDLANNKSNYTRFIIIALIPIKVPQNLSAKTSLFFTTKKYVPGSLIAVLNEFSKNNINLVKLNSRPRELVQSETWEEIFFADVQANLDTPVMQQIVENLKQLTGNLKILGCYPSFEQEKC